LEKLTQLKEDAVKAKIGPDAVATRLSGLFTAQNRYNKQNAGDAYSRVSAVLNALKRALSTLAPKCLIDAGRGVRRMSQVLLKNRLEEAHVILQREFRKLSSEEKKDLLAGLNQMAEDDNTRKYLDSKLGLSERILFDEMRLMLTDDLEGKAKIRQESHTHLAKLFATCSGPKGCAYLSRRVMRQVNSQRMEVWHRELLQVLCKTFTQHFVSDRDNISLPENNTDKMQLIIQDPNTEPLLALRYANKLMKVLYRDHTYADAKDFEKALYEGNVIPLLQKLFLQSVAFKVQQIRRDNLISASMVQQIRSDEPIIDTDGKVTGYKSVGSTLGYRVGGQILRKPTAVKKSKDAAGATSYVSGHGKAPEQTARVTEITEAELVSLPLARRRAGLYIVTKKDGTKEFHQVTRELARDENGKIIFATDEAVHTKSGEPGIIAGTDVDPETGKKKTSVVTRKVIQLTIREVNQSAEQIRQYLDSLSRARESSAAAASAPDVKLVSERELCGLFLDYEPTILFDSIELSPNDPDISQTRMDPKVEMIFRRDFADVFVVDSDVGAGKRVIRSAGDDLYSVIAEKKNKSKFTQLADFTALTPVAKAIDKLAALGIVLRDLKPENMGLGRDGRVRVFDLHDSGYPRTFTKRAGTPGFCDIDAVGEFKNAELQIKNMYLGYLITEIALFAKMTPPLDDIEFEASLKNLTPSAIANERRYRTKGVECWNKAVADYLELRVKEGKRDLVRQFLSPPVMKKDAEGNLVVDVLGGIHHCDIGRLEDVLEFPKESPATAAPTT
jgi:hypothetical protein